MELGAATIRVKLRNAGIEKAGKQYGWKTKREFEEVAKELEALTNGAAKPAKKAKEPEPPPPPKKAKKFTLKRKSKVSGGDEATA